MIGHPLKCRYFIPMLYYNPIKDYVYVNLQVSAQHRHRRLLGLYMFAYGA